MSSARSVLLLLLGVLCCGCDSRPRARTAFDPGTNFGAYQTFAMKHPNRPVPSPGGVDPFTLHRMRQMTFAVLKQRGLEPAAYTEAQLHVAVHAEPEIRTEVIPASTWTPYPRHYYGADVRTFETVVLEVHVIDAPRGAVVWYGRAETITGPEATDDELWPLVQAVLAEFPPGRAAAQ
ncbi:MAG TPA: DUF4136 domain-containing protein [Polyangiaceae bacterium]|nr:DUF4136 domain-containing protein [Polyangiaceae bacterium]